MSTLGARPRDVMPLTWELPAAAALAWAGVAAVLLPAGLGAAAWLSGHGWVWPSTGAALGASLTGLLAGHPASGLVGTSASGLPAAGFVYLLAGAGELAWLAVSLLGLRAWWRTWGPGMRTGLAGRAEVEKVLGRSRMRRSRVMIRPDLYAKASASRRHR